MMTTSQRRCFGAGCQAWIEGSRGVGFAQKAELKGGLGGGCPPILYHAFVNFRHSPPRRRMLLLGSISRSDLQCQMLVA